MKEKEKIKGKKEKGRKVKNGPFWGKTRERTMSGGGGGGGEKREKEKRGKE